MNSEGGGKMTKILDRVEHVEEMLEVLEGMVMWNKGFSSGERVRVRNYIDMIRGEIVEILGEIGLDRVG